MSDTKIQMNNRRNQAYTLFLQQLYIQRRNTLRDIEFVKNKLKENKKTIYIGFQYININWYYKTLQNNLKINIETIQEVRSKLIIC